MTLLGLLATLLFGGIRFGTRVWEAGEQNLSQLEEIQSTRTVLRRVLSEAVPRYGAGGGANSGILFDGTETRIDFLGPAPAQAMPSGLYWLRLSEERALGRRRLVLSWQPVDGMDALPVDATYPDEQTTILLNDIADLRMSYYGRVSEGRISQLEWRSRWEHQKDLPREIRVDVRFADGDRRFWVDLVVSPMVQTWP